MNLVNYRSLADAITLYGNTLNRDNIIKNDTLYTLRNIYVFEFHAKR